MRPRVFPAEDDRPRQHLHARYPGFNEAAGIPRGRRPARLRPSFRRRGFNEAAGIPRGRPAARAWTNLPGRSRFNEAAGIPRGRRRRRPLWQAPVPRASMRPRVFPAEDERDGRSERDAERASMRPRVFPAEDGATAARWWGPTSRFNEAAGIPRGRLGNPWTSIRTKPRFNEAAGIPRGRLEQQLEMI